MSYETFDIDNPGHRAALQTARSWGVPWRRFQGWEPKTTTHFQYSDSGQLVRTESETEPLWNDEDVSAAIELTVYESECCPGCGHPLKETTKKESEFLYKAGDALRCHRCTTAELAMNRYQGVPAPGALMVPIELREATDG